MAASFTLNLVYGGAMGSMGDLLDPNRPGGTLVP